MAEYFIGIDLGTTHSAIFYTAANTEAAPLQQFLLPQLIAPGQVASLPLLPSFIYMPHDTEFLQSDLTLPWGRSWPIIGALARDLGAKSAGRMIQSAKSWLCHRQVAATEAVLPIDAVDGIDKLSPAMVTQMLLDYIKRAWNHQFPEALLEHQDIVITVPASFDPAARAMTEQAASAIGLTPRLIEEPLAAFYAWLADTPDWQTKLELTDQILVVDVGGGTTDLSLIKALEVEGCLQLERVAVGKHILLGGDNMDIALTYHVATKLAQTGTVLEPWQITALTQACRQAKESLLVNVELDDVSVVVPNRGKSLFANNIKSVLTRADVSQVIVDGFFPPVAVQDKAQRQTRLGISRLSLEYESDPAITRHISEFISSNQAKPTKMLLNGGVFNAQSLQHSLQQRLQALVEMPLANLTPSHLDYAVAKGACFFAQIQTYGGVKVKSGLAANYYIGVESPMPAIPGMLPPVDAICVAPFGMEEGGESQSLPSEFALVVGESVSFRFFRTITNEPKVMGSVVPAFALSSLEELANICLTLPAGHYVAGELVRVYLTSYVTDLGVLQLVAKDTQSDLQWTLEYQVREI